MNLVSINSELTNKLYPINAMKINKLLIHTIMCTYLKMLLREKEAREKTKYDSIYMKL